jgi:hypothetical protein
MSLDHEYRDLMNNLHILCPENTDWHEPGRTCYGWLGTDFDTIHRCPIHPERATDESHPDYEPPPEEEPVKDESGSSSEDWHSVQAAHQIIAQCKIDAARSMERRLIKQRDTFYPESKGKAEATALLNAEIEKVREHIRRMEAKEYDRWDERCEDWRSDIDFWPGQ